MKIIDCFTFFNALDLLEIRLNCLAPYVERFIICECPVTHSGNPKPLYFDDNKDRYKGFNITHVIADDGMVPLDFGRSSCGGDSWRRENYQRDFLQTGIGDVDPDTWLFISDMDEIPDMPSWSGRAGPFNMKQYFYYLNTWEPLTNWRGTMAIQRRDLVSFSKLRDQRRAIYPIVGGGWHFGFLGSAADAIHKIESFCHREVDRPEVKARIPELHRKLLDPYRGAWGRRPRPLVVEMPSGPQWLLDNRHRYPHLFYSSEPVGSAG